MNINDIVVKRADTGDVGNGDSLLWIWDSSKGKYTETYKYWENPYVDDNYEEQVGHPAWGNEDEIIVDVSVNIGDAIWIKPGVGTTTAGQNPVITIAGEVVNPGTDVQYYAWDLVKNQNDMVSNPFPGVCNLNDIVVARKDTGDVGNGDSLLWAWNESSGKYTETYKYWENPYIDDNYEEQVGHPAWGNEDEIAIDVNLSAGQGFWIKPGVGTTAAGQNPIIQFRNPFYISK